MRCFGMLLDGRAQTTGIRQRGKEATLLLVINGHHDLVEFTLPACPEGVAWSLLIDTNCPDEATGRRFEAEHKYGVTGRSTLLFEMIV